MRRTYAFVRLVEMPAVPPFTQIDPRRIHGNNQLDLLDPKPAFDAFLAVNRVAHIVKALVINEPINLIAFAKRRPISKLVFPNAPMQVICNSDVERLGAVGQNVNAVVRVIAGMHRSFASLRMTGFKLCIEKMRKSVRGVQQNCDDLCLAIQSPCHPERSEGPMHFPASRSTFYFTSTFSIYSATCTFHPNSFFIRSRSCDEAAGSPWTK